jgi:hypothetical protein
LARFGVHVNVVLCKSSKDQFKALLQHLSKFGFFISVGLVHNEKGVVAVGGSDYLDLWEHLFQKGTPISLVEYEYGKQLLGGQRPVWQCRAGARYLYVDEFGNTQFCSAQLGRLNKPIMGYTREDIRRHSTTYKGCEVGCSLFCVYRSSQVDNAFLSIVAAMFRMLCRGRLFDDHYTSKRIRGMLRSLRGATG